MLIPNLVVVSGSEQFLLSIHTNKLKAPTLFSLEFSSKIKSDVNDFKVRFYKHILNGRCSNLCIPLGFYNHKPSLVLTTLRCAIGDFIDYSYHPVYMKTLDQDIGLLLTKNSIATLKGLKGEILLPTFKFLSGGSSRKLTRKELFDIWGHGILVQLSLEILELF